MFHRNQDHKYSKFKIKKSDKYLIVAPHPDDESLGCGGFLIKNAGQCDVIVLTDGSLGDLELSKGKNIEIRNKELKAAMSYIGVNDFLCLNIPDKKLRFHLNELKKINFKKYNYVFVPNRYESHIDHACVHDAVKSELRFSKTKLVSYEIWSTLPVVSNYFDISDIISKKNELINIYQSQMKHINYRERLLALNFYRGMRSYVDYAEAFYIESNYI
jgi:LmbE family N-acetylglucosaminyl deacetylase